MLLLFLPSQGQVGELDELSQIEAKAAFAGEVSIRTIRCDVHRSQKCVRHAYKRCENIRHGS
jgi:hypothetical protein